MNGHRAKAIRREARNPKYYTKALTTKRDVVKILKDIYYGKFGNHSEREVRAKTGISKSEIKIDE